MWEHLIAIISYIVASYLRQKLVWCK